MLASRRVARRRQCTRPYDGHGGACTTLPALLVAQRLGGPLVQLSAALLCAAWPFPSPLRLAAQHVVPIIASIDRINTIPKVRCRNRTIQHHPITPLTPRIRAPAEPSRPAA